VIDSFTEGDAIDFRSSIRSFLQARWSISAVRDGLGDEAARYDSLCRAAAQQLGLQAVAIPENLGGAGYGLAQVVLVAEELGAALADLSFLSSAVMSTQILLHVGDEQSQQMLLPHIAEGTTRIAAACAERDWFQGLGSPETTAYASGRDTWTLNGRKDLVLDGQHADRLLVTARTQRGTSLFLVEHDGPGVGVEALPTVDLTRHFAKVRFDNASGRLVGTEGEAGAGLTRATSATLIALAAEQVGGARQSLDQTLEYLTLRTAFGRQLGSFQALKHRCATLLIEIEAARALVEVAANAADRGDWIDASRLASLAKVSASEAFTHASGEMVQLHGGIGFTWEHDAHLYFKRARASQYLFGTPHEHGERALVGAGL
jgi:alkylation response protein AidB-like acyl-CoA dehydrogenase